VKAVGTFAQGIAAYDAGKYTRKVMGVNSQNTYNASLTEQEQIRHAARAAMGRQIVAQGSSGFQVGTGSGLDSLRESMINRELDLALSRNAAKQKADDFRQQGQLAYAQGKSAMAGGIISGAEQIAEEVASAVSGGAGGAYGGGGGSVADSAIYDGVGGF
jgi:hypothetical protein